MYSSNLTNDPKIQKVYPTEALKIADTGKSHTINGVLTPYSAFITFIKAHLMNVKLCMTTFTDVNGVKWVELTT